MPSRQAYHHPAKNAVTLILAEDLLAHLPHLLNINQVVRLLHHLHHPLQK
jgi:hypothetical protein